MKPSYHDLHITTEHIERTSIFNLPFDFEVSCNRVGGWSLWKGQRGSEIQLASEYGDNWLILDVNGHEIVNSQKDDSLSTG